MAGGPGEQRVLGLEGVTEVCREGSEGQEREDLKPRKGGGRPDEKIFTFSVTDAGDLRVEDCSEASRQMSQ